MITGQWANALFHVDMSAVLTQLISHQTTSATSSQLQIAKYMKNMTTKKNSFEKLPGL